MFKRPTAKPSRNPLESLLTPILIGYIALVPTLIYFSSLNYCISQILRMPSSDPLSRHRESPERPKQVTTPPCDLKVVRHYFWTVLRRSQILTLVSSAPEIKNLLIESNIKHLGAVICPDNLVKPK